MRSKQERTSKPPPPPLQPSLKGEGWSLGMREGSFQEDMADVANESTAGTAGGERAAGMPQCHTAMNAAGASASSIA